MTAMASLSGLNGKAIALLAAVFLVGVVTGLGATRLRPPPPPPLHPPGGPLAELDLAPDQHARIRAIHDRHRPELDAILKETMPRVRAIQEGIDNEVGEVLTPEQRKKFQDLKARMPPPPPGFGPMPGGPPPGPPPPGAPPPGAPPK